MPIKGVLMAIVMVVVLAFIYRKPLSKWYEDFCREDDMDNKDFKDFKEENK